YPYSQNTFSLHTASLILKNFISKNRELNINNYFVKFLMVFYPRIAVIKNYFEYDNNKQRKKKATLTYKLDSIQKIKKHPC
ncbi:hypothetical protein EKO33_12885, partial [Listeria monocytogenes]|nr:hypothetical protein [Listeria monocytogenes]MCJ15032.1 hypothetical protein [Listeria monocytogenes]